MKLLTATLAIVLMVTAANADTIALWTFETSLPATAGPIAPEEGSGVGTAFHTNASAVYSNPVGNGSAESWSSNYWSVGDYYQFQVSTTGLTGVQISFDQTSSSTGPGFFALQASTNGVDFTDLVSSYSPLMNGTTGLPTRTSWSSSGSRQDVYTFGPTASASLDNQANVYFRLIDISDTSARGDTVAVTGTNRVDNVLIEAVPEPMTLALLGLGGLAMLRRRK